jgi:putative ABC transport system ATP-binding protein
MLEIQNVTKSYLSGGKVIPVLRGVSFSVEDGESVAIVGPSGSGKSTLLAIIAGLDKPDSGSVLISGENLVEKKESELAEFRNKQIGYIFQTFELMPSFTVLENVMFPLEISGIEDQKYAELLLEKVGLSNRMFHYPSELSGGEQQRVAIARAFVNRPNIIFADEPTGNIDQRTSVSILDLLFSFAKDEKKSLILVTHELSLAKKTERVFHLQEGVINTLS